MLKQINKELLLKEVIRKWPSYHLLSIYNFKRKQIKQQIILMCVCPTYGVMYTFEQRLATNLWQRSMTLTEIYVFSMIVNVQIYSNVQYITNSAVRFDIKPHLTIFIQIHPKNIEFKRLMSTEETKNCGNFFHTAWALLVNLKLTPRLSISEVQILMCFFYLKKRINSEP